VQGLWHDPSASPRFSEHIELDLSTVVPSIAGPKRPQDRISLSDSKSAFEKVLPTYFTEKTGKSAYPVNVSNRATTIKNGDVVIASITSCTNTSNPSVMIGAALLAKKAVEKGLTSKPWVKTTLAPGSKVVTDYYDRAGLTHYMQELGFHLVGYGCVTCIGNSGPLPIEISKAINENDLAVSAVLSGNRNFEGRISPDVKMNYLASPPLVVAYALAGTMNHDFEHDSLGNDKDGNPVLLKDIWPSEQEIQKVIDDSISSDMFTKDYATVFEGDHRWKSLDTPTGKTFDWDPQSTYVRKPPYFENMPAKPTPVVDINGARVLAILGDSVTTDHISPAGNIKADSPAGKYLESHGVARNDFNSYGSRRGNHEVMIRGTFANIRLKNMLLDGVEGGFTRNFLNGGAQETIYDASMAYQSAGVPLVIIAGKEYGSGSSRDWAAKGTALLGVRAVIAESFERIHRSNLIGMGVLPLQFLDGQTPATLGLKGDEVFAISGITALNSGGVPKEVTVTAGSISFTAKVRIDTPGEADYYRHGGIMQFVLRQLLV
jgi:aconitate hydratase